MAFARDAEKRSKGPQQTTVWSGLLKFSVVAEKDEDRYYVGTVSELPGCHTQAKTLDELIERVKEAVELYLELESPIEQAKSEL